MGHSSSRLEYDTIGGGQIRLLLVHPSKRSGTALIRCELHSFPLDLTVSEYAALSYVWGSEEDPEFIRVNKRSLPVAQNLHAFLKQFSRDIDKPTWIWIDAVCINQDDNQEKSWTVQRMQEIYKTSKEVLIWLGPAREDTAMAFEALEWIAKFGDLAAPQSIVLGPSQKPFGVPEWEAMSDIFHRSYWSRAWIIQEATTSPAITSIVCCGPHRISLNLLHRAHYYLSHIQLHSAVLEREISVPKECLQTPNSRISEILQVWEERLHGRNSTVELLRLLHLAREQECKDPRDKIYSVVKISDDIRFTTDYSREVVAVYTDLVWTFIRQDYTLDILGSAGLERNIPDLPTWVPDWTVQGRAKQFRKRVPGMKEGRKGDWVMRNQARRADGHGTYHSYYEASGDMVAIEIGGRDSLKCLNLLGFNFDVVLAVSEVSQYPKRHSGDDLMSTWGNLYAIPLGEVYVAGGATLRAFRATLAAGIGLANWSWSNDVEDQTSEDDRESKFQYTTHRRLVVTNRRYLGLAPKETQPGDLICVLFGGQLPFVLRRHGAHHELVGEAYVHGIMNGEWFEKMRARDEQNSVYSIV